MVVLVLGGRGFIGRHVVAALAARGHEVVVGSRLDIHTDPRARHVCFERLSRPAHWYPLLCGMDVVVNAVGILRKRDPATYELVHRRAPAALARACAYRGLRLVHISALGLRDTARSRFILSKLAGERAVAASGSDYSIVRPSLVDGEGGFGASWIRWFARWPVHFVSADARGRIAALDARDLGEAIAVLCEKPATPDLREVELGGTDWRAMRAYLAAMRPKSLLRALVVPVPSWMARENLLPALLGRSPRTVGFSSAARDGWGPGTVSTPA